MQGKLKKNDDRWYSHAGPGKEYEESGGYLTDNKHSNRLTVYFCENNWVLADIVYSTGFERYAYLPKYAVDADHVPEVSSLEYYEGVTNRNVVPSWGPDDMFETDGEAAVSANTSVKVFFRENQYGFAEFACSKGTVRMWLPLSSIAFR